MMGQGHKKIIKICIDSDSGKEEYERIVNDPSKKVNEETLYHTQNGKAYIILKYTNILGDTSS